VGEVEAAAGAVEEAEKLLSSGESDQITEEPRQPKAQVAQVQATDPIFKVWLSK